MFIHADGNKVKADKGFDKRAAGFLPKKELREAFQKKKCTDKDIVFICLDALPTPINKDIKNRDILVSFLGGSRN